MSKRKNDETLPDNKEDRKRIIFTIHKKDVADFYLRLKYDEMAASVLLRHLLKYYLMKDERIMTIIDEIKEKLNRIPKKKRELQKQHRVEAIKEHKQFEKDLALSNDEKDELWEEIERRNDFF